MFPSVLAVVRAAIPDATMADAEHILWERTPFPFKRITARTIYRAASGCRRAAANGRLLCDHCPRAVTSGGFMCDPCASAIRKAKASSSLAARSASGREEGGYRDV